VKRAIKYTIGYPIPAEEILKRFKDEDGETFLEVRGLQDLYFRVTDGDRVYYKIEKSKMKGEELTLVEDYTVLRPKSLSFHDVPTAKHKVIPEVEETDLDMDTIWGFASDRKQEEKLEDLDEFEEGQPIPESLQDRCKENDYGGYTFRYNKFLYLLDSAYCVEIKSPDTHSRYESQLPPVDAREEDLSSDVLTLTDPISEPEQEAEQEQEADLELQPGDTLPAPLRSQCESQLGHGYGSRIIIGHYLYHLSPTFKVQKKMKISYEDEGNSAGSEAPAAGAEVQPGTQDQDQANPPVDTIINNLVDIFQMALDHYQISADYFKESVLGTGNREALVRAYHGDLESLNDDTREASSQGKKVKLEKRESGLNLLKAALIHELYIKTTVSGRGEMMKYFLTHIAAAQADGTVAELQDDLSKEDQQQILEFFKNQSGVYTDKTEIIKRIHLQFRFSLMDEYKELWLSRENVWFNALLIARLYQNTTRLDRGDGITMIRLTRDLLESEKINSL
jgi:hypothetical protein